MTIKDTNIKKEKSKAYKYAKEDSANIVVEIFPKPGMISMIMNYSWFITLYIIYFIKEKSGQLK
jgi:hypothetical protein